LFCADFSDVEQGGFCFGSIDEETAKHQFELQPQTMCIWVDIPIKDAEGHVMSHFHPEFLTAFEEFGEWSEEKFWGIVQDLHARKREEFRRKGYDVESV
jgi:hypothetical protein